MKRKRLAGTVATSACVLVGGLFAAEIVQALPEAVQGSGTAYSETIGPRGGGRDFGKMATAFSPAHIEPGDPVRFTSSLSVYEAGFYDPHDCSDFHHRRTDSYDSFGLWRVRPGKTAWGEPGPGDEPPPGFSFPTPEYSNFTRTTARCPDGTFEEHGTVHIRGAQTAQFEPGCYQGAAWDSDIWFHNPVEIDGTIATLAVGDRHCARDGRNDRDLIPRVDCFKDSEVCRTDPIECDESDGCASARGGSAIGDPDGGYRLFSTASSVRSSVVFAKAKIHLYPNERRRIKMPLTDRGRKLLNAARRAGEPSRKGWFEFNGTRSSRREVKIRLR
jgi:hypothetical protein